MKTKNKILTLDKIVLELVPKTVNQWKQFQGEKYWETCRGLVDKLVNSLPEAYHDGTYSREDKTIRKEKAGITAFDRSRQLFIGFSCANPYNLLLGNSKDVVTCPTFDFVFKPNYVQESRELVKLPIAAELRGF